MTIMNESINFTNDDGDNDNIDNIDDFQELLDNLPQLSPIVNGKRGGGRKATNNIGADILGEKMLNDLRTNHHVDLSKKENVKGNTLFGVIDQNSYSRAVQISRNIKPSYPQVGVQAVSIAQNSEGEIFLQLWKGTVINGVLTFQKVYSKSKDYRLGKNKQGLQSFWKVDSNGDYSPFSYNELVNFEDYLNAIVVETEYPVSFPSEEVNKLQGLSEILANVNLNSVVDTTEVSNSVVEFDEEEDEVEE